MTHHDMTPMQRAPRIVSQLDTEGWYLAPTRADPSPAESDGWMIPRGATDLAPPGDPREGYRYRPDSAGGWVEEAIPVAPAVVESRKNVEARMHAAIGLERDRRQSGGVQVDGIWWHSDSTSRLQYLGLRDRARDLVAAGAPIDTSITVLDAAVVWKTLSGDLVPMTVALSAQIVNAIAELDAVLFAACERHRDLMRASSDPSEYDYAEDWPTTWES